MDAKLKAKWVKVLRSGKFTQGYGKLRCVNGAHCCLGVLCVVGKYRGWRIHNSLPDDLVIKAGLTEHMRSLLERRNDSGKWSFARIADYIEKHL